MKAFRGWPAASVAAALTALVSASAPKPNIVFILTDDLGVGDLGILFQNSRRAAGDRTEPWHFTPKLDAMGAQGARLTHHYCPAPVCAPSRASLLTGLHQGHANVRDNQFDKALEDNHTLGTVLKGAGYATAAFGKWGLQGSGGSPAAWPAYPTKRGFDYYLGYVRHNDGHEHYPKEGTYEGAKEVWDNDAEISADLDKCYTTDLFASRAKRWIQDHVTTDVEQPFFVYLAFDTPHAVLEYPPCPFPAGAGLSGGLQWLGTPGHMINTATGTVDSYVHPDYASATYDDDTNAVTPEVAWPPVFKRYATAVRRIDDCVGDVLALLQDLGAASNTLVVFSSDNGPSNEDYLSLAVNYAPNFFNSFGPHDGIKRDCWEGGVRMPLLAWWPGTIPTNRVNGHPAGFWDWMPTFAELAGVPPPARTDGVSLVPALTGVGTQATGTVYVEYYVSGTTPSYAEFDSTHRAATRNQMQLLRLGNYKGVRYNIASHADNFRIYDVVADPKETNNLAASMPALQQQMKDRVLQVRRPDASAARPYDGEAVPPVAGGVATGLAFRSFDGPFPWVPDFAGRAPAATGVVAAFDVAARHTNTHVGLEFTGLLWIPQSGDYTFYVTSDQGAVLHLHDALVVDDDFGHTGAEVSGTIKLATGLHPVRLAYAHGTGATHTLSVKYAGPGLIKQTIPASALFHDGTGAVPAAAVADAAWTPRNTPVSIDVAANDYPAGMGVQAVGLPVFGTASIVSNRVRYVPATNFLGTDRFMYTATGGLAAGSATVAVDVVFRDGTRWFPLDEATGTAVREAGGAPLGELVNADDPAACWVTGRLGRALSLDGTNDYVRCPGEKGVLGASNRTCAAWIRVNTGNAVTNNEGSILAWGGRAANGQKWNFRVQSNNGTAGAVRVEVEGGYIVGSTDVRDGQWHHVAAVFANDGSPNVGDIRLYVDGATQRVSAVSSQTVSTASSNDVLIGVDQQSRYFDGTLDDVRIYDRALSAAEIAALASPTSQHAAAWARRNLGDAAANWAADADGDGWPLLAEYAFGGAPNVPDAVTCPRIVPAAGGFQIVYWRRTPPLSDAAYDGQSSADFATWGPWALGPATVTAYPLLGPDFQQVSAGPLAPGALPLVGEYRLRITLAPPSP